MVSIFKRGLHSDAFQTHEMNFSGDFGGEFSKYGYITRLAEKRFVEEMLTDDLSQAQQKFGYLKGLWKAMM